MKHAKTSKFESLIALLVTSDMTFKIVLTAIDFDNERVFPINKIDDVPHARCLAAEMKSALSP